jgi:hypothetical protein
VGGGWWVAGGLVGWVGWLGWLGWLVGWAGWAGLVGWLAGWLVGLVGLVGWLVGWLGKKDWFRFEATQGSVKGYFRLYRALSSAI